MCLRTTKFGGFRKVIWDRRKSVASGVAGSHVITMKDVSVKVYLLPMGFGQLVKIKHISISARKYIPINANRIRL